MRKYITMILVVLIAVVLIILIKDEFSWNLLRNANYGMPALVEKGYVDNLYIGSSMFRQGIDIMVLEENGEENYVLAYNGNQPVLEYFQLKNIVNSGVRIQNLYVDLYVYSAWAEPKISDEKMLMEYGLRDTWNQWKLFLKDDYKENVKLFWQMFVTGNNELLLTWPLSSKAIDSIFYKGGSVNKPVATSEVELNNMDVPQIAGEMDSVQIEYLDKLIKLAKSNNINIVFIETPKYCNMANHEAYIEAVKKYIDYLDNEGVDYILCDTTWRRTGEGDRVRHYAFENDKSAYYVDNGHLSYEGRVEFTRKLYASFGGNS